MNMKQSAVPLYLKVYLYRVGDWPGLQSCLRGYLHSLYIKSDVTVVPSNKKELASLIRMSTNWTVKE